MAYPIEGFLPVVEGRAALGELFGAFTAAAERIEVHNSASTRPTTPTWPSSKSA